MFPLAGRPTAPNTLSPGNDWSLAVCCSLGKTAPRRRWVSLEQCLRSSTLSSKGSLTTPKWGVQRWQAPFVEREAAAQKDAVWSRWRRTPGLISEYVLIPMSACCTRNKRGSSLVCPFGTCQCGQRHRWGFLIHAISIPSNGHQLCPCALVFKEWHCAHVASSAGSLQTAGTELPTSALSFSV